MKNNIYFKYIIVMFIIYKDILKVVFKNIIMQMILKKILVIKDILDFENIYYQ